MHDILASQFRASMAMLRSCLTNCTDELWRDRTSHNLYWQIAYHAVFFADLYTSRSEEDFKPRRIYVQGVHFLGQRVEEPICTTADLIEILDDIDTTIGERLAAAPFDAPSGFDWVPLSKAELHIYNIRHIQHHAGQLMDRLRSAGLETVKWVGKVPKDGVDR